MNDSTSRQGTSKAWLVLLCLLSTGALANWQESLPEARVVGAGELRLFGLRIYSARLWSPAQPLAPDSPFALELTYHRAISREQLVDASVREIRRLYGDAVSAVQLAGWRGQMLQAFVDVEPGSRITGVHLPGQGARFYVGRELKHEVRDQEFARAFFAIWLDPRTRNPELRAQLLGAAAP
ncbi:hypothetical protein D3C78_1176860 [compost metagenome]